MSRRRASTSGNQWFSTMKNGVQRKSATRVRADAGDLSHNFDGVRLIDLTFRTMTNSVMDDPSLSLSNYFFENDYRAQMKSAVELDETINAMVLPNL
jgi:hypothetical protein